MDRPTDHFDLQGHRGARGAMPENTIPGFIYAIEQGVNTLELDLVVTKDDRLVVSHEPYMSAEICLASDGSLIDDTTQYQYNIFKMTYEEVARFDCGSKPHPHFPDQQKQKVGKPLLSTVLDTVDAYLAQEKLPPVSYNMEIKSRPEGDEVYHPAPADFSDLVFEQLDGKISWDRVTIQSFDFRILQYFNKHYPQVTLALLIENDLSYRANLDSLGFYPEVYSCHYKLLDKVTIDSLHSLNIKVIPWTVNEVADMRALMEWGVDGLITDYPQRFFIE